MLRHRSNIKESDAAFINKRRSRRGKPPIEPLYTQADATASLRNFHAIDYARQTQLLPGVSLTYLDAGHMLGSAIVVLNIEDRDTNPDLTLVVSVDLGQPGFPILRDPTFVGPADVLICESTYGDRVHETYADSEKELERIVIDTYKRGGKLIVPAFAVGRTQEIVYALHKMWSAHKIPHMPIYVD